MLGIKKFGNYYYLNFHETQKFNFQNAFQIEEEIMEYVRKKPDGISLDMSGVIYFDSTAIECLLNVLRNAKLNNTSFILKNLTKEALEYINVMNLDEIFTIDQERKEII